LAPPKEEVDVAAACAAKARSCVMSSPDPASKNTASIVLPVTFVLSPFVTSFSFLSSSTHLVVVVEWFFLRGRTIDVVAVDVSSLMKKSQMFGGAMQFNQEMF
jgi:hypothetical protein